MGKVNYQKELDEIIRNLNGKKPTVLLHACCGPCSSACLEYLYKYFEITVFYYNPNIFPPEEYFRRLNELKSLYEKFPPVLEGKIKLVECDYNPQEFYDGIEIKKNPELANEAEKGERCRRCYKIRLEKAYNFAKKNNFDYFCTTLSISPFKDSIKINKIGNELERGQTPNSTKWLPSDFKKNNGFKRSLEISSEYGMYRQEYCGCVYSKQNKEKIPIPKSEDSNS